MTRHALFPALNAACIFARPAPHEGAANADNENAPTPDTSALAEPMTEVAQDPTYVRAA